MSSNAPLTGRTFGSRGSTMAVACGTSLAALLGGMYSMGRDTKSKEGQTSVHADQGKDIDGGQKAMNSSDVSKAVVGREK